MAKQYRLVLIVCGAAVATPFLCCGGCAVVGLFMNRATENQLAEADRSWDTGQHAEAVGVYEKVIDNGVSFVDSSRLPTLFQRVVEFEVERGNTSLAKQYAAKAMSHRVALASAKPEVKTLLDAVRAEHEAAEKKRQEEREAAERKARDEREAAEQKKRDEARAAGGSSGNGSGSGATAGSVQVGSKTVRVEVAPDVASEVNIGGFGYNSGLDRITVRLTLLAKPRGRYTRWRYTVYDDAGTALESNQMDHPDLGVGESGASYFRLAGNGEKVAVVKVHR